MSRQTSLTERQAAFCAHYNGPGTGIAAARAAGYAHVDSGVSWLLQSPAVRVALTARGIDPDARPAPTPKPVTRPPSPRMTRRPPRPAPAHAKQLTEKPAPPAAAAERARQLAATVARMDRDDAADRAASERRLAAAGIDLGDEGES